MARASIGGPPIDSKSVKVTTIRNPATGETVDTAPAGTRGDAQRAIDGAQAAFEGWADLAASKRAEILYRGVESVLEHKDELARLLAARSAHPGKAACAATTAASASSVPPRGTESTTWPLAGFFTS